MANSNWPRWVYSGQLALALRRGAAEQVIQANNRKTSTKVRPSSCRRERPKQVDRALVDRADPPFAIKGQQPFAELADIFGLRVEAQQPFAFIASAGNSSPR